MQVLSKRVLRDFWEREPKAKAPLTAWYKTVSQAEWNNVAEMKATFRSADVVSDNRVIFDVGGNKYRVIAHVAYRFKKVLIKFVGTHKEYDAIDPETV